MVESTPKKDAESKQKKRLVNCTVKSVEAAIKVRVPETCESGESDSDHVFVHRKVKTEVKDVDQ